MGMQARVKYERFNHDNATVNMFNNYSYTSSSIAHVVINNNWTN